jgi:hypothetical protein
MRAKQVHLVSVAGGILGAIGFRCELEDGTFWVFAGKAVPVIGFHGGGSPGTNLTLELRTWSLAGTCGFSSFEVSGGVGLIGLVLWDWYGTVGKLTGVEYGSGGVGIMPVGFGSIRKADSING